MPTRPTIVIPGLRHPKGIGVNLWTHRIYVASRDTDVVYEVDAATVPAHVIRLDRGGRSAVRRGRQQPNQ